jgi:hypothetical protein
MQMIAKVQSTAVDERQKNSHCVGRYGLTLGKEVALAERRALVRSHLKTQQTGSDQFVRQIRNRKWFSFNSIEWSRVGKKVGGEG